MRLAGKEKGGFYPTMPLGLAQIVRHIRYKPGRRVRLLDPCAGKGEALITAAVAAQASDLELLLVELNHTNYRSINGILNLVQIPTERAQTLHCAWEDVVMTEASAGLLWLNPPYDFEAIQVEADADDPNKLTKLVTERVEYKFLKSCTPKLQPDGLLIYIIPLSVIQRRQVLRWLATHYHDFVVRSVPDPEYDHFDQVVVFARRKAEPGQDADTVEWLAAQVADRPTPLSDADDFTFEIPEAPEKSPVFRKNQLTYGETAALVAQHGAQHEAVWQLWNTPKTQADFRPAGPPKLGHIATLITSGAFNVVNLGDSVIRGAATKREVPLDDMGNIVPLDAATQIRERYDTEIYKLDADGNYKIISKPEDLEALLRRNIELLHAMTAQRFKPLYNGDPTRAEWEALAGLMPTKKLPGRQSAGLLLAQKHAIIAMKRVLEQYKSCFLVADMGTGKGPMGYGIAHSVDAFPLLVICPSHLVEKHAREAKDTLGDDIKVVIVTRPSQLLAAVDEYEPGQRLIVIAAMTTWSLGPGVHRVRVWKKMAVPERDPINNRLTGKRVIVNREVCPRCGKQIDPDLSKSSKPVKCNHCEEPLYEYGSSPAQYAKAAQTGLTFGAWADMQAELMLGGVKRKRTTIHRWPLATVLSRKVPRGFFKGLIADEMHKFKAKGTNRGYAFQRLTNAVRYVINTTGTIFGGYASDLFYLLYRTMPHFRQDWGFNQTGQFVELYGKRKFSIAKDSDDNYHRSTGKRRRITNVKDLPGISPAIYPLMLRQTLFMRIADLGYQLPDYAESLPTVMMDGALYDQYDWLHSTLYEEIKRKLTSFNSAEIKDAYKLLSVWLSYTLRRPQSAFRSEVVMRVLPADDEEETAAGHVPHRVSAGQSELYGYTEENDRKELLEWETNDTLSLDESDLPEEGERGKPAAAVAFDKEQIRDEAMVLYPAIKIGEWLPKESWLMTEVPKHVHSGRKVLIYVEQTASRDIQPRLKRILEGRGLRVKILPDGVAAKREAWINNHLDEMDVLITNPRKVETGLDLVAFSVLIFLELPTSLFTLQQAMKRVWRLGQTQDVLVLIPHHIGHDDIMENRILQLMADKVKSAALLYGDSATSAFADEGGSGDVTAELAKQIMQEAAGAAPTRFADGIKSLLGDLVQEELAASRAAIEAAVEAGEEAAGTGVGILEIEEGEENLFDELDALFDEKDVEEDVEETDTAAAASATAAAQFDLFDFENDAANAANVTTLTTLLQAGQTNGNVLVVEPAASTQATNWMPKEGDTVYIESTGDYRTAQNLWTIDKIEGGSYWVKRMHPEAGAKSNRRKCNRFQLVQADAPTTPENAAPVAPEETPPTTTSQPPVPEATKPTQPHTIAPNQTFEYAGHTYRLRPIDRIGDPYAEVEVKAEQQIPGQDAGLPVRTWPSLLTFMAETGLKPIADRNCTAADLQFLRDKLATGTMILLAIDIGLPTIHTADNGYPEAKHHGFGFFGVSTPDIEFNFDAGGAMRRTENGISWSQLRVTRGTYPYPFERALAALEWWLHMPEPPAAPTVTAAVTEAIVTETAVTKPAVTEIETGDAAVTEAIITEIEAGDAATSEEHMPAPSSAAPDDDDFFAAWDLNASQPATDLSVLAISPKRGGGKKAAKAIGANDAFRRMMTSEPTFR